MPVLFQKVISSLNHLIHEKIWKANWKTLLYKRYPVTIVWIKDKEKASLPYIWTELIFYELFLLGKLWRGMYTNQRRNLLDYKPPLYQPISVIVIHRKGKWNLHSPLLCLEQHGTVFSDVCIDLGSYRSSEYGRQTVPSSSLAPVMKWAEGLYCLLCKLLHSHLLSVNSLRSNSTCSHCRVGNKDAEVESVKTDKHRPASPLPELVVPGVGTWPI